MRYLFLLLFSSLSLLGLGQTSTASGDWETDANWSGGTAPPTGIDNQTITIGSGFPITRNGSLRFNTNSNGSIDANDDFTIAGDLTWSANSNNASIASNGIFIVNGNLVLENNAGSNINIDIGTGGVLIVQGDVVVANGALNGLSVTSGGTLVVGGDFDLGSGSNIVNNGSMYGGSTSGSASITGAGGTVGDLDDLLADDPTLCGLTTTCAVVLPVSLLSFEAMLRDTGVQLDWATATEENNEFFSIERSIDGRQFETIAIVEGAGNSTVELHYSYFDSFKTDFNGFVYYRLSQTDYDGTRETFDMVALRIEAVASEPILFPNPSASASIINLRGVPEFASWRIYSINGEEVKYGEMSATGEISTWGIQPGSYLLEVREQRQGAEQFILIIED